MPATNNSKRKRHSLRKKPNKDICTILPCKSCLKPPVANNTSAHTEDHDHYFDMDSNKSHHSSTRKKVWFEYIEIREFPIILGDNPTTTEGIPVTLDWEPQSCEFCELEYFELYREQRRYRNQLLIDPMKRVELVLRSGSSLYDIGKTAVEMAEIQSQRAHSSQKTVKEMLIEGFQRTFTNTTSIIIKQASSGRAGGAGLQLPQTKFSRVPNEAPKVLTSWKKHGKQVTNTRFANAAA